MAENQIGYEDMREAAARRPDLLEFYRREPWSLLSSIKRLTEEDGGLTTTTRKAVRALTEDVIEYRDRLRQEEHRQEALAFAAEFARGVPALVATAAVENGHGTHGPDAVAASLRELLADGDLYLVFGTAPDGSVATTLSFQPHASVKGAPS